MRGLAVVIALGLGVLATPALAQDQNDIFDAQAAARAKSLAVRAAALGDWPSVTALLEKVYRNDPNLGNEFNLATAYARTGQTERAVRLYEDVAKKGQFNSAVALYEYRSEANPLKLRRSFNYSDEALRRIALLQGEPLPDDR
jgi:tetratricopeptide (TPR) repeat protein